jgi:hypothetical protein
MTKFLKPTLLPAGANFGDSLSISLSLDSCSEHKSDAQSEDKCSLALHTVRGGRQGGQGGEQGEDSNSGNRSGRSVGIGARSGNRSVVSTNGHSVSRMAT